MDRTRAWYRFGVITEVRDGLRHRAIARVKVSLRISIRARARVSLG
jgi:hypothetical protein